MNLRHRRVLHAIFAQPAGADLAPRQVCTALEEVGADVSRGRHGQVIVKLNGYVHGFHDNRDSLSREEVGAIRKLLASAGVDPARDWPI